MSALTTSIPFAFVAFAFVARTACGFMSVARRLVTPEANSREIKPLPQPTSSARSSGLASARAALRRRKVSSSGA
jgi:hypothetical protein